jgi:hypothetical protein
LNPAFKGQLAASHTQTDLEEKAFFNYTLTLGKNCTYTVFTISEKNPEGLSLQA